MRSQWAQLGFIGAILLSVYGLVYFTAYALPESLFGVQGAAMLSLFLGALAGAGGLFSALGFPAFYLELGNRTGGRFLLVVCDLFLGMIAWGQQFAAHLLLGTGALAAGALAYRFATIWIIICFLFWGFTLFLVRKELGARQRYGTYAALLFLINALGWIGYLGIGVLIVASLLNACVLASPRFDIITAKREYQIGQLGLGLLTLYCILAMRWLVNALFPLPLAVVTPLNFIALISAWLAVLGFGIAFSRFEVEYGNPMFGSATAVTIGSLLLLSVADFTWLMSNVAVFVDPVWGVRQYRAAPYFWGWSTLPLCVSSLLCGLAFLQVWLRAKRKGDIVIPILSIVFFASALAWLYGLGYLPLIIAVPLLLRLFMRIARTSWQPLASK